VTKLINSFIIALIVFTLGFNIIVVNKYNAIKTENAELKQQIQAMQQEKAGYKEGKYTLITNLSSSIYLNKIPASFEDNHPWEDVNGVRFFDVTVNGTHYRYVEGHIEMPQLALYAPNMHLEVVSETKWPKEGP
jgi:hypothetical protein